LIFVLAQKNMGRSNRRGKVNRDGKLKLIFVLAQKNWGRLNMVGQVNRDGS